MPRFHHLLPLLLSLALVAAALAYGPIAQPVGYHDFADQGQRFGIAHFADVVSNLGFLLVALWGLVVLAPARHTAELANGWAGYRLFLVALLLTALGSTWYHLAPDNARLVWDRLPIAMACGGLLAGVWGDSQRRDSRTLAALLALAGVVSVAWWHFGELAGAGDLRPYLLLQALPFLLVPLWQWQYGAPRYDRWIFAAALVLYALAKGAEVNDQEIAAAIGMTGHTLKHLLAALSCALIVIALRRRTVAAAPVCRACCY
jgi:hypothetical protein